MMKTDPKRKEVAFTKKQPVKIKGWSDVDLKLAEMLQLRIDMNKAITDCESISIKAQQALDAVVVPAIKRRDEIINPLRERYEALFNAVQDYAEANKEEFKETKTKELENGKVFFRRCPPSIKCIVEKTEKKVIEIIKKSAAWKDKILREKFEIDKTAIKKAYEAKELKPKQLEKFGLKYVDDEETFALELKGM